MSPLVGYNNLTMVGQAGTRWHTGESYDDLYRTRAHAGANEEFYMTVGVSSAVSVNREL
jgi:hypothetical protein